MPAIELVVGLRNIERAATNWSAELRRKIRLTLIVQIVLGLLLLVGLVTISMSSKNWHWTQLVLVLFTFFAGIGYMFLAAETLRMHKNLRAGIPKLEQRIAALEKQNEEYLNGGVDKPGILELDHRLQILSRERGRVWRGVLPTGQVSQQGVVSVEIAKPQPHGLETDAIIYAFEMGNPNVADPPNGAQYLGEFRVTEANESGATLEPILLIDNRSGNRLANSRGPWSLYETMPIDRHRLFASFSPEQLQKMLPAETVEEYLRHGSPATPDDDEWHVIGLDADGKRLGPENMNDAVKKLYDRNLRDYAFVFGLLAREKVVALAQQAAVSEDIARLKKALASAEETGEFRQGQIDALGDDLTGMKQDRLVIETHRDAVLSQLNHFRGRIQDYLQANSALAEQLTKRQLGMVEFINSIAPSPATPSFLGP